jgi:hypothetical protein
MLDTVTRSTFSVAIKCRNSSFNSCWQKRVQVRRTAWRRSGLLNSETNPKAWIFWRFDCISNFQRVLWSNCIWELKFYLISVKICMEFQMFMCQLSKLYSRPPKFPVPLLLNFLTILFILYSLNHSLRGLWIFPFTTASRTAPEPTQPPIQCVPGALSLGVKRPRREADHSTPSSAEVKGWVELYLHSPNTPSWRGAQLKHRTTLLL